MIGSPAPLWKLLLSLALPSGLVGLGMFGVGDARIAFGLYVLVGCGLGPWLLLGSRPLSTGGGLRWSASDTRRVIDRRRLAAWLAFGPLFFAGYTLIRGHLGDAQRYMAHLQQLGWRHDHEIIYAIVFVALIPLMEEWWWRGQALPQCVHRFGHWPGILLTSASYAAYHGFTLGALYDVRSAAVRLVGIFVAGAIWSVMAIRFREWGTSYFAHLGADMAIAAAFFLYVA